MRLTVPVPSVLLELPVKPRVAIPSIIFVAVGPRQTKKGYYYKSLYQQHPQQRHFQFCQSIMKNDVLSLVNCHIGTTKTHAPRPKSTRPSPFPMLPSTRIIHSSHLFSSQSPDESTTPNYYISGGSSSSSNDDDDDNNIFQTRLVLALNYWEL